MAYTIDIINQAAGTSYVYDILSLNAYIIQQGGTGGHTYRIDALNELCTIAGANAGWNYEIDALNAISVAIGGTGGHVYEDLAWTEIASIGFGLSETIKSKLLFLWTGKFSGHNLLSDLDSTVITVTGKDFSTSYIPATSVATFAGPASFNIPDSDLLWYSTEDAARDVTPTELFSYDFQRTLVMYDNESPYHIRKIAVLKSGETLTAGELDEVHEYFKLSQFWSGVQNDYGYAKSNRAGQNLFYEAESLALLARFTTPATEARKRAIDNLVKDLKNNAIWQKMDVFVNLRAATLQAALLNWIDNDHNATLINSPTFTADAGVLCAVTGSKYIGTDFLPSTDGVQYARNSATVGVKVSGYNNSGSSVRVLLGCNGESPAHDVLIGQAASRLHRIHSGTTAITDFSIPVNGYNIMTRTGALPVIQYNNGTKKSANSNSSGIPTREIYVGASNENGTAKYFIDATIEMFFMASAITDADEAIIRNSFNTYISAL